MLVMDDLMADIDGWAIFLERFFDNVDGALDARTKSTRFGQQDG